MIDLQETSYTYRKNLTAGAALMNFVYGYMHDVSIFYNIMLLA